MKKILVLTTISRTINAFLIPHILDLVHNGYTVEIACRDVHLIDHNIYSLGLTIHEINLSRNPFSLKNIKAYRQLNKVIINNQYDIIHTHTPIVSAIVRLIAKKYKLSNIYYTAHGFHFYKGAPLINWLLFYPIEKYLSKYTNTIITINNEDYNLATKKFHSKRIKYIPGIGVDFDKFFQVSGEINYIKGLINIQKNNLNIFSVGEINKNKNHIVMIKALRALKNSNVHYFIVGEGKNKPLLKKIVNNYNLNNNVHFLGFRQDIPALLMNADLFAFPSRREGLGLAAIEALLSDVPLLSSNIHGINDYSIDNVTAFKCNPNDYKCYARKINFFIFDKTIINNLKLWKKKNIQKFSIDNVINLMNNIYQKD